MDIDWDQFQIDLDNAIIAANEKTDAKLAGLISGVTRLTDAEVAHLFPNAGEVKRLAELMEIVKRSGKEKDKINNIVANAEKFGGIIFKLLTKFV